MEQMKAIQSYPSALFSSEPADKRAISGVTQTKRLTNRTITCFNFGYDLATTNGLRGSWLERR
jgi:hypothetical protein